MVTKVKIALQGGGAKLVASIAAMRAVQKLAKRHRDANGNDSAPLIEITEIAGTSAGSIAAVLLAADVPMQTVLTYFEGLKPADVFPPKPRFPMLHAYRGFAIMESEPLLRPHLLHLLSKGARADRQLPAPQTFDELEIKNTCVIVSDLQTRTAIKRTGGAHLLPSIIDSCSLPFILKNRKSGNNPTLVDGGLCANLPAEMLSRHDDKIPTLCFSFVPDPPSTPTASAKDYALAVLFTAIDSHVARIKTDLRTTSTRSRPM